MRKHFQCQYLLRVVSWYSNDITLQCIQNVDIQISLSISSRKSLYCVHIPLPHDYPYIGKNVLVSLPMRVPYRAVLNSNAHLKKGIKNDFTLLGLLSFLKCLLHIICNIANMKQLQKVYYSYLERTSSISSCSLDFF